MFFVVFAEERTVEALARRLREGGAGAAWSPLVRLTGGEAGPPFFCVHPAGGSALCFADLARHLGPDQPFHGLQARGLVPGQAPHRRVEEMAADYLEAVRGVQGRGPYLLGGWSLGGLVALEMARRLESNGERVALLALIDTPAQPASLEIGRVEQLAARLGLGPEHGAALAAHTEAARHYQPAPYAGRIAVLRAAERPEGAPPEGDRGSPDLGWGARAAAVEVHLVPGHHFSMVREPHARALAARLRALIASSR